MTAMRIEPEDITLPPELALAGDEPDITPVLCDRCENVPAEYTDQHGNYLCASCVDNADEILNLKQYEPWTITGTETAEWSLRRLAEARNKIAQIEAQARAFNERIDKWAADQIRPLVRDEAFFDFHLKSYAALLREQDPKCKSLKLPSGTVSSRMTRPGLEITDEDALVAFLRNVAAELDRPVEDFLAVQVKVKKDAVKGLLALAGLDNGVAVLEIDGEPVPGVEVKGGGLTFSVKIA